MNAVRQLISKLSEGSALSSDDIVVLGLLAMMAASLIHLLTMLSTRWGDHNTTVKSLLASILIHGVGFLGLEVFEPTLYRRTRPQPLQPEMADVNIEILLESDQDVRLPESGNMAYADRPTETVPELNRLDSTSPEIVDSLTPERIPDELESLSAAAKDVTQFEQREMTELALPTESGTLGPKQVAAEDIQSDVQATFDKSNADVFAPEMSRTVPRSGRPEPIRQPDEPSRPLSARELKLDVPQRDVAMSLATETDTSILVPPVISPEDEVARRSAPTLSPDASDGSATMPDQKDGNSVAATFQSRLPRPARSSPDRAPALRPSKDTPSRAQTPTPLFNDYDDVRIGDVAPSFSDSLAAAAPLMVADLPSVRRRENSLATYELRNVKIRRDAALKFGGTRESETAVEKSLRWLASRQSADGRWDASDHGSGLVEFDPETQTNRNFAGREADTGLSALVILSFLGAGYTHENGPYAPALDHALDWLIAQQGDDGNLCGNAEHYARMYCHAMATYALAEACGMQREQLLGPIVDPEILLSIHETAGYVQAIGTAWSSNQPVLNTLAFNQTARRTLANQQALGLRRVDDIRLRAALAKAVTFTIGQQDPRSGGWRYKLPQEGDVSMFGWQMMSLKSAEIAGVTFPAAVTERMNRFLNSVRQGEHGGLFGYKRNVRQNGKDLEPVTPTMTAEALFCQQMLGYPRETKSSVESIAYLMRNPPRVTDLNFYYWYYGTLAVYQYGGRAWEDWNPAVRDVLISLQVNEGPNAGSWDPNDKWGRFGGRLYSTALATLTLEVYYRFLPLYRMNDALEPAR